MLLRPLAAQHARRPLPGKAARREGHDAGGAVAPAQAAVLPLADRHNDYAHAVAAALGAAELRADVDDRTESVGRKIREAELRKVPYMLVVGDREAEEGAVALRRHGDGDQGSVPIDEAVQRIVHEAA